VRNAFKQASSWAVPPILRWHAPHKFDDTWLVEERVTLQIECLIVS
jgi:hypothetical protein